MSFLFKFIFHYYSLRMRKDLRDIFDQIRAESHTMNKKSEDITVQNNVTLSIPRTTSEQIQSNLAFTYLIYKNIPKVI